MSEAPPPQDQKTGSAALGETASVPASPMRGLLSSVAEDLRYALRGFLKSPSFAVPAILSIGIGVGASTAIFSVVNALLLEPLPYADAQRLAILWNRSPGLNIAEDWFSTAQYFDIKNGHQGFEQVAIAIGSNQNLTGPFEPERVGVLRVSSNLLPMLGVKPHLGRLFIPEEDVPGRSGTVLLSQRAWRFRFGSDPAVLGRSIILNGQPFEVVGVLPEGFSLPREVMPTLGTAEEGEMFLPLALAQTAVTNRGQEDYNILAKLKPGVTRAQAQSEMTGITSRLRAEHPDVYPPNGGLTFDIVPLLDQVVGGVRPTLLVLAGSVALVLLIACANVANLLLSRAMSREKEMAVRVALGAGGFRLARQLVAESLLLAAAGGALGVGLSFLAVKGIQLAQPTNIPRLASIAVNGEVLLFTIVVSAIAGLLFGLAPALGAQRINPAQSLMTGGRGSTGANLVFGRGHSLRRVLVVGEIALSMVLLIVSGLLVRTMSRLQEVRPGFDPQGVLTLELTMTGPKYADANPVRNTYRELWSKLDALPGVSASGGVTSLPLSGFFAWGPIAIEGRPLAPGEAFINADQRVASGRYFEAMGIPLLKGRYFNDGDTTDKDRVIIIDEHMANEFWPGREAVGQRVKVGDLSDKAPWRTVVGVVGRVKQYGLDSDGRVALYVPHTQSGARSMYVTVRTTGDPMALAGRVRSEIHSIDRDLPLYRVRSMTAWIDQSLARPRFAMSLLTFFAAVALVLASIGIYSLMAFLVAQGTREIGIRMAIGASEGAILSLVLRQGLRVAVLGALIGFAGALSAGRLLSTLLFGVGFGDPATFAASSVVLGAIAVAAIYMPARRASRTDPIESLRME
jgi:predicted permease